MIKHKGNGPLGKLRLRWEGSVKICLKERGQLDSTSSGYGLVASSCDHGNEPWGCIKGGEFLDHLSDYQIVKTDSI
jgi:hypothetical protein